MSTKKMIAHAPPGTRQSGVAAVEFALVALFFFTLLFAVIEYARLMLVWTTVQEVTRRAARAASVADFSQPATIDRVRQYAIFRDTPGPLPLTPDIDDSMVRIAYLNDDQHPALLSNPAQNLANCAINIKRHDCIRFVRAQLCQAGGAPDECRRVPYTPMLALLAPLFTGIGIPSSPVLTPAESLGYRP